MPPQGLMHFPGIEQIVSGIFTLSHGITPSAALIQIVPQFGVVAEVGTFRVSFDGVVIDFPDSVVDSASLRRTEGGLIWSLRILDRRWKWRYREINGWYNRRVADGTLDTNLEKTPRELATLCLQAMDESNFDVSELPDQTRPEVNWVYANPANELAAICDSLGCRVVLGIDNTVRVRRKGVGAALPVPSRITDGFGIDPPEKPDAIKVVGTRVYQSKFRLEAVGKDTDGTVKKIDDLSYKPSPPGTGSATWTKDYPEHFDNVLSEKGEDAHKLALETVFRWYRIEGFLDGTGVTTTVPGETITVDRWNVLPLGSGLVSTYADPDGNEFNNPPIISGEYYDGRTGLTSVADTKIDEGWSIDAQQGIVRFSRPKYKYEGTPRTIAEADLILEITHPVKDPTTRQDLRYERQRTLTGSSFDAGTFIIRRDEIVETRQANYEGNVVSGVTTNTSDVDAEADSHIDAAEAEFEVVESQDVEYAGIVAIQPDGAIQQVSWTVGLRGAFTRASTNSEFDHAIPPYARRREIEEQREALKRQRGRSRSAEAAG